MDDEEYKDDPEQTWQQLQAVLNGEDTFLTEQERTALERRYRLGAAVEADLEAFKNKKQTFFKTLNEFYAEQAVKGLKWGDYCRAKCSAPARYVGNGKCVYVSAMCNDLSHDDAAPAKGDEDTWPQADDDDLRAYCVRYKLT